jgi:hypothetical protein
LGLRKQFAPAVFFLLIFGMISPEGVSGNILCDSFMYKNEAVDHPTTQFSPRDRIVVRVKFKDLQKGSYTFQADWYNPLGEFQDTSSSYFNIEKRSNVVSESQLELMRAGTLRRLFSTSETKGYHIKFYGVWKVKLYLNGEKFIIKEFEIH